MTSMGRAIACFVMAAGVAAAACGGSSGDGAAGGTATAAATPATPATTAATTAATAQAARPEGERMIDVGGHRLAIRCMGQAAPTVILESGAFPTEDAYAGILPEIARDHRVCSYDRAGVGKSEPGPLPRDGKTIAGELATLLANAGETGPFVLVSWSIGGVYTPLYAIAHADDVAGYVFVDPRVSAYQLEVGADPILTPYAESLGAGYAAELAGWDEAARQVRDAGPLPPRPLIVLTAGSAQAIADGNTREGGYALWRSSQADLAASVPGGKQIVVEDASHQVWAANPAALLDAIDTVD